MITRRAVALGGILSPIWNGCCGLCAAAAALEPAGCIVPDDTGLFALTPESLARASFKRVALGSGDRTLDYALAQTLSRITEAFRVLPGFVFYDDRDFANSFATPRLRFARTDGTVLFGLNFLRQFLSRRGDGEIALTAICAHEFAHIVQFKRGLVPALIKGRPTVERCELHADFLAGYFAGTRKNTRQDYPAGVFAVTLASLKVGNNYRRNHGTPGERAAAIERGFDAAYREKRNLDETVDLAMNYVDGDR